MQRTKRTDARNTGQKPGQDVKLYSYVVEHDNGYAPNPYFDCCTLCGCKFEGGKNIIQLAKKGDWIVGTGGASRRSAGHGMLIYAMRVDKKIPRTEYFDDPRFDRKKPKRQGTYKQARGDNEDPRKDRNKHRRHVLISRHFWYFGAKAVPIPEQFRQERPCGFALEKTGPGFRSKFEPEDIRQVIAWLEELKRGIHGDPCGKIADEHKGTAKCKSSC
jgi:hypothetical protein